MSVLKNKRNLSHVQFLSNLASLMNEVRDWCKSQGTRNDNYGLVDLFQAAKNAYVFAVLANEIYPKDNASILLRRENFDKSLDWIHVFNSELTAIAVTNSMKLSNTKIKRWEKYAYLSKTQIDGVKKSDTKRKTRTNK